jgi:hypothetical protein
VGQRSWCWSQPGAKYQSLWEPWVTGISIGSNRAWGESICDFNWTFQIIKTTNCSETIRSLQHILQTQCVTSDRMKIEVRELLTSSVEISPIRSEYFVFHFEVPSIRRLCVISIMPIMHKTTAPVDFLCDLFLKVQFQHWSSSRSGLSFTIWIHFCHQEEWLQSWNRWISYSCGEEKQSVGVTLAVSADPDRPETLHQPNLREFRRRV